MSTLYLIESKAAGTYLCAACGRAIPRGKQHYRHDPFPAARIHRGQKTTHWCLGCIAASNPGPPDKITGRLWIPTVRVLSPTYSRQSTLQPARVEIFGAASLLVKQLAAEPELIHRISPQQFEEVICERLGAMDFEAKLVGSTNRKDGGVDIVFWSRTNSSFPFLGAVQVKHHRNPFTVESSSTVRDFSGVMAGQPFNAGLIVTNTTFSPDAEWFARERAKLVRLRGFNDIRRWMFNIFNDNSEWREIPTSIELCPGVIVDLRKE